MNHDQVLGGLRWKIDVLDSMLADLLRRRLELSLDVQAIKEEAGLPAEDLAREADMARRWFLAGQPVEVAVMLQAVVDQCKAAHRRRQAAAGAAASATSPPASGGSSTPL